MNKLKQFKRIYIEITNVCNLSCSFCPPLKREKKFMNVEEFKYIIKEISPFTDYVYLHVKGEPLMHKHLAEFLKICEDYKLQVNITTNGTRVSAVKDILYSSPALRQLNISLHSFENVESYANIAKNTKTESHANIEKNTNVIENTNVVKNTLEEFDLYLKEIVTVAKYLKENTNTITAFRLWNLDKDNLTKSNRERNYYVLEQLKSAFDVDFSIEEGLGRNNGIKLTERIYLNQDYEFDWPNIEASYLSDKGHCYGLKTQLAILVDGSVVPCCLDEDGTINLGNIFKENLSSILNSKRAVDIKEGFSRCNVVEELCKRCGYRERFI